MKAEIARIFARLEDELGNALLSASKSIGAMPPESRESRQLQSIHARLSAICHDVMVLRQGWEEPLPPPPPPGVLHLKDKVGDANLDQTQQMLNLIETEGAAKVYVICKKQHIVATRKTTHLFVDKEPYTLAQPAKAIQGEDGYPYYVYCCMSMEQKQKRLDEVAKWL